MWGMADAFSRSPANVRDGWCVPQKTADVRGQLILYLYLLPMPMTTYHWLLLLQAILCYSTSLLIINYCHTKLYTINHDNRFDTQRLTTQRGQQSPNTTALPLLRPQTPAPPDFLNRHLPQLRPMVVWRVWWRHPHRQMAATVLAADQWRPPLFAIAPNTSIHTNTLQNLNDQTRSR